MQIFEKIKGFFLSYNSLKTVITLIAAFLAWRLVRKFFYGILNQKKFSGKKVNNFRIVLGILKYAIFLIAGMIILEINGINVTGLATSIGIAGVVVGFALQDMLKDLVMGANIIMDDYFAVGDIVEFGDIHCGEITAFNLKATRILDLDTGNTAIISNRSISKITKLSDWQTVVVPAPYWETAGRMGEVCQMICEEAEENKLIKECRFLGTDEFDESTVNYKLYVVSEPKDKPFARRAVLGIIQNVYEREQISVPYNQLDVHMHEVHK